MPPDIDNTSSKTEASNHNDNSELPEFINKSHNDCHFDIDVFILTATPDEIDAVLHQMEPISGERGIWRIYLGPETYFVGMVGLYKVVASKCHMGATARDASILSTFSGILSWKPRAVIMVGIAFGKSEKDEHGNIIQRIGDVLVSSQVICYESQRLGAETQFRGPIVECGQTLKNRFSYVPGWRFEKPDGTVSKSKLGPILSGEKLIDDSGYKAKLFAAFPQAIGGEMEAAGIYAASTRLSVEWIVVKAICDWADGHKGDNFHPLAATAAMSLVTHVLRMPNVLDGLREPLLSSISTQSGDAYVIQGESLNIIRDIWQKLQSALGYMGVITSPFIKYPQLDFYSMSETQLRELIAPMNLAEKEVLRFINAEDKPKCYVDLEWWSHFFKAREHVDDFHNYLLLNKIFINQDVATALGEISTRLMHLLIDIEVGRTQGDYRMVSSAGTELRNLNETKLNQLEATIRRHLEPSSQKG